CSYELVREEADAAAVLALVQATPDVTASAVRGSPRAEGLKGGVGGEQPTRQQSPPQSEPQREPQAQQQSGGNTQATAPAATGTTPEPDGGSFRRAEKALPRRRLIVVIRQDEPVQPQGR